MSSIGGYKAYVAEPRTRSLKATVLVIHENRGLNEHIRDVARRVARCGLPRSRAVDFLSPVRRNAGERGRGARRDRQARPRKSVADAVAMLDELSKSSRGGKVGAVGFCWGGGFVTGLRSRRATSSTPASPTTARRPIRRRRPRSRRRC